MQVKAILCVLLVIALLSISIVHGNCDSLQENTRLTGLAELSFIEVRLAWEPQYDSKGFLNLFIKPCYAALPPQYQPHYKHTLKFNHDDKSISDVLKKFTGEDPSLMKISEIERDTTVYEKFKGFLVNTTFLCEVTWSNEGWVGPAQPLITFHKTDGSVLEAYFYNCRLCQKRDTKLCSQEFSEYLLSLQTNRLTFRFNNFTISCFQNLFKQLLNRFLLRF